MDQSIRINIDGDGREREAKSVGEVQVYLQWDRVTGPRQIHRV
jgi:hypothetical protein